MIYFTQWIVIEIPDEGKLSDVLSGSIVMIMQDESFIRVKKEFETWVEANKKDGYKYRLFGGIEQIRYEGA